MNRFFRRTEPKPSDNVKAGLLATGLAAGVAAVSFYFARLFLAREELEPLPSEAPDAEGPSAEQEDVD